MEEAGRAGKATTTGSAKYPIVLSVVFLVVLTSCGRHYWNKPGAVADDFVRDSDACAHENFLYPIGTQEYGLWWKDRNGSCL